jgi:hypothetical protein
MASSLCQSSSVPGRTNTGTMNSSQVYPRYSIDTMASSLCQSSSVQGRFIYLDLVPELSSADQSGLVLPCWKNATSSSLCSCLLIRVASSSHVGQMLRPRPCADQSGLVLPCWTNATTSSLCSYPSEIEQSEGPRPALVFPKQHIYIELVPEI